MVGTLAHSLCHRSRAPTRHILFYTCPAHISVGLAAFSGTISGRRGFEFGVSWSAGSLLLQDFQAHGVSSKESRWRRKQCSLFAIRESCAIKAKHSQCWYIAGFSLCIINQHPRPMTEAYSTVYVKLFNKVASYERSRPGEGVVICPSEVTGHVYSVT